MKFKFVFFLLFLSQLATAQIFNEGKLNTKLYSGWIPIAGGTTGDHSYVGAGFAAPLGVTFYTKSLRKIIDLELIGGWAQGDTGKEKIDEDQIDYFFQVSGLLQITRELSFGPVLDINHHYTKEFVPGYRVRVSLNPDAEKDDLMYFISLDAYKGTKWVPKFVNFGMVAPISWSYD